MRTNWCLLIFVCAGMWASGCLPEDMPAYVNDGKTVVAVAGGAIWTCDVQTKTAASHPTSQPGHVYSARKIGDYIFVHCRHDRGKDGSETLYERFDPAKNEFVSTYATEDLGDLCSSEGALPVAYEGKKCLFVPTGEDYTYDILSMPRLEKQKTVQMKGLLPAGNFWWLTMNGLGVSPTPNIPDSIDVFNSEGKSVCTITYGEARNSGDEDAPNYARVSADGKVLLLAHSGGRNSARFAVFDTSNGKFLWGYSEDELRVIGTPLVTATEVWTFNKTMAKPAARRLTTAASEPASASRPTATSAPSDAAHIELVRYTRSTGADISKAVAEVILVYPLDPSVAGQFTPSPDGAHMVMMSEGKTPRLLFFPLKTGITEKDVTVVELKAKE